MGKFHKYILPQKAVDGSRIALSAGKVKKEVAFSVRIRSIQNGEKYCEK
jgi:hypothetical protein